MFVFFCALDCLFVCLCVWKFVCSLRVVGVHAVVAGDAFVFAQFNVDVVVVVVVVSAVVAVAVAVAVPVAAAAAAGDGGGGGCCCCCC